MEGSNLTPQWDIWRRKRFHKFLHGGMKRSSSDEVSRCEAAARQRVEQHAGRQAALAAGLAIIPDSNGIEKIVLLVPPDLIPPERRQEAEKALYVSGVAVCL